MKKISEIIKNAAKWISADGMQQIIISLLLCVFLYRIRPVWLIPVIVVTVWGAKEIYCRVKNLGVSNWHDIICKFIGIAVGMLWVLAAI